MSILSKALDFLRHEGGNVATIFSIALLPVAAIGGGAIDFSQAMNARGRLAEALDSAALAVGSQDGLNAADAESLAMEFITANYPTREIGTVQSIDIFNDNDSGVVRITGQSRVATTLLGIIGMDYITVDWTSEVVRAQNALELVMVLDNTGSMSGSKIRALREAALTLNNMLHDIATEPGSVRVGLVPFAASVNVGTRFERAWWLDADAEHPLHSEWFEPAVNRWDMFDTLRGEEWDGCVEAREMPMDIDDTPPNRRSPNTLFVPYFAPDEPDQGRYANNYIDDESRAGDPVTLIMNSDKYLSASPGRGGPNRGCTTTPITALTSNRDELDSALRAMEASGTTNIAMGVSWGIRVISPQEPFTEGVDYDEPNTIKAMVILTDGENVIPTAGAPLHSEYTSYGYLTTGRLGITSASRVQANRAMNARTEVACEHARQEGIRVYTISFGDVDEDTRDLMSGCASHPSLYFNSPTPESLQAAFELIAGDLSNLRISR